MRRLFKSAIKITQEFGVNPEYYSKFGLKSHEGLDCIPTGTVWDVLCLEDGVVVKDVDNPLSGAYGVNVTVWHTKINKATQYCHFKENYVTEGQLVKTGDKLGLMGKTGNTAGSHVHLNLFETDENGIRLNRDNGYLGGINPLPFLNEEISVTPVISDDERRALAILVTFKEASQHGNLEGAINALVGEHKDLEAAKTSISTLESFRDGVAKQLNREGEKDTSKIATELAEALKEHESTQNEAAGGLKLFEVVTEWVNGKTWIFPDEVDDLLDKFKDKTKTPEPPKPIDVETPLGIEKFFTWLFGLFKRR